MKQCPHGSVRTGKRTNLNRDSYRLPRSLPRVGFNYEIQEQGVGKMV